MLFRSVADAAGYSRGLPAHYFGKKEDLLARVAEFTIDSYPRQLGQISETEGGLPRIEELIRIYVRSRRLALRRLPLILTQALVRPNLRKKIGRASTRERVCQAE